MDDVYCIMSLCLCQENAHLSAQVSALDSVVCGLREERKLWGHELALQGASLAQERGRMEAKIESLTAEVRSLRDQQQVSKNIVGRMRSL